MSSFSCRDALTHGTLTIVTWAWLGIGCLALAEEQNAPTQRPTSLTVAAAQMRSTRDLDANLQQMRATLERCAADGVQVVVFPECAVTGYFPDVCQQVTREQLVRAEQFLTRACRELRIALVAGTPWREQDKLYNSAVVINAAGQVVERYHKVQLAENWPDAGDHLSVFYLYGVPCSVIVCHDERYPELVRLPVLSGARVVFYVSHESPLSAETKLAPYRAQIQARAVENTVYVVQSNAPANLDASGSHGQSRLIAPDGNILHEAGMFTDEVIRATLDLRRATASNALNSIRRGPLIDWYTEGMKRVRIIP